MNKKAWKVVNDGYPRCTAKLQYHSLTVWCLCCRWARNWRKDEK